MDQEQGSSNQGKQQRPAGRRRRRRRRRSSATGISSPPVANRARAAKREAAPSGGDARERTPRQADPASAPAPPTVVAVEAEAGSRACPVCGEQVRDLYTAIAYGEHNEPAHFDCIVALLGEREELEEGTRVCYLGGGSFGIVQVPAGSRQGDRATAPWVRKRIEVEDRDAAPAWREELRLPLPQRRMSAAANEAAPCK